MLKKYLQELCIYIFYVPVIAGKVSTAQSSIFIGTSYLDILIQNVPQEMSRNGTLRGSKANFEF